MAAKFPEASRRRVLKAGLAVTALFLPTPYAWVWAQSEGTLKLLRAPKFALVIGNSAYKHAPLKNPANDARAIAESLKNTGFDVTVQLETSQTALAQAVDMFTQGLAKSKGVGLFYFAGHGLQLAWRNYMIPVDADIRSTADIQKQGVEVGTLLSGITKAVNPLNIIILDACRDNPFGGVSGLDQKGLSQMDAPPSTLLAYATAPGNVASDGEGVNGLYTENLLRELKTPDAKIEDVFKRVRLHVRRSTNGTQIPWESTSLEEDFYFVPPKELKRLSEREAARQFEVELALWEKIKTSREPRPLEEYLLQYPSGRFSELAQLQLDQILARQGEKKIEVVSDAKNPFSKGSATANTHYKVGDSYTYRVLDQRTRIVEETFTARIVEITDSEVIFGGGRVTDLLGNTLRHRDGRRFTPSQAMPLEFAVGKQWTSRYFVMPPSGGRGTVEIDYRIVTREQVTVPAGTFEAFRIEGRGWSTGALPVPTRLQSTRWFAPESVRNAIIAESHRQAGPKIIESSRWELVAFKES